MLHPILFSVVQLFICFPAFGIAWNHILPARHTSATYRISYKKISNNLLSIQIYFENYVDGNVSIIAIILDQMEREKKIFLSILSY